MTKQDIVNRAKAALKKGLAYGAAGAATGAALGAGFDYFDGGKINSSDLAQGALGGAAALGGLAALKGGVFSSQKTADENAKKSIGKHLIDSAKTAAIAAPVAGAAGAGLGSAAALQGI